MVAGPGCIHPTHRTRSADCSLALEEWKAGYNLHLCPGGQYPAEAWYFDDPSNMGHCMPYYSRSGSGYYDNMIIYQYISHIYRDKMVFRTYNFTVASLYQIGGRQPPHLQKLVEIRAWISRSTIEARHGWVIISHTLLWMALLTDFLNLLPV